MFLTVLPLSSLTICLYNIRPCEDVYEHLILLFVCVCVCVSVPSLLLRPSLITEEVGIKKNDVPIRNKRLA